MSTLKRIQNQKKLKKESKDTFKSVYALYDGREMVCNSFKNALFPIKPVEGTWHPGMLDWLAWVAKVSDCEDWSHLKILNAKQILQRLLIVQVKAGNTSENLLNETCKIIYSLYQVKEITAKVYNNVMNSIKV